MWFRQLLAKLTATFVILCLFPCTLQAALPRPLPSMSAQAVHDTVAQLGVGKGVYARISSPAPGGGLLFSFVGGKIVSFTDRSVDLSVRNGHTTSVQTFAYKDIDELSGAQVSGKHEALALAIVGGAIAVALIAIFKNHPPAQPVGGPGG